MPRGTVSRLARVTAYARGEWPVLAGIVALTLAYSAIAPLAPWPFKLLVDYGLGGAAAPEFLAQFFDRLGLPAGVGFILLAAAASVVLFAVTACLDAALTLAWSAAGQRMVYSLATDLFVQLQRLSLVFHARRSVGDSLSRVTGDAWSVYTIVEGVLVSPAKNLMVIATIGAIAWQLDASLTLVMLGVAPALVLSATYFGNYLKALSGANRAAIARLTGFVHQCLGAIPVVQVFGAQRRNEQAFAGMSNDAVRASRGMAVFNNIYGIVNGTATTIGIALIVYLGGQRVLAQQMSVGTLLVFVAYVRMLEEAARSLLSTYGNVRSAEASVERVLEVLDSAEAIREAPGARPLPPRGARGAGHIAFERVSFGYEAGAPVLTELTLEVPAGTSLALVGSTGAGKTTLASLIPRFFDVHAGRVTIDGVDVRHLQLASLRGEVALVLQEAFILPLTVAENIAYGKSDATREDIVAAAVAANAHDFIVRLPQGYDTTIGEHGATLSGGEQQRISIARALLKDARVLILDEPTSALDSASEQAVMDALKRLMAERTTLIIAHRLSTARVADRIAVIEDGRIAEAGSHDELTARGGRYAKLYALHAVGGNGEAR
jgi:ATP-binding cassette, subfamily B, bacterial